MTHENICHTARSLHSAFFTEGSEEKEMSKRETTLLPKGDRGKECSQFLNGFAILK